MPAYEVVVKLYLRVEAANPALAVEGARGAVERSDPKALAIEAEYVAVGYVDPSEPSPP
jgi:hypothetical protein